MPTTPPGRWHCCLALRLDRFDMYWILMIHLIYFDISHFCGILWHVALARSSPCSLSLGTWRLAKFEVHSATKFFSGHADCTGGLVCVRDPEAPSQCANVFVSSAARVLTLQTCSIIRGSTVIETNRLALFSKFVFSGTSWSCPFYPLLIGMWWMRRVQRMHAPVGPSCGISSERGGYGLGTLRVPCRNSSRLDSCRVNVLLGLKLAIYRIYRTFWFSLTMRSFMVLPHDLSFQTAIWSV